VTRREIIKAIKALGGYEGRDSGKHTIFHCACGKGMTPVPRHREIPPGTVRSIERLLAHPSGCFARGWLRGKNE